MFKNLLSSSEDFQNVRKLKDRVTALCESTVDVERTFSKQTPIKTKRRNRMKPKTLSSIMKIQIHGSTFLSDEFFNKSVKQFYQMK